MIAARARAPLAEEQVSVRRPVGFPRDRVACLARTYDAVARPIWVHDLAARCVYRNHPARYVSEDACGTMVFEIMDHQGRTVGHLTMGTR